MDYGKFIVFEGLDGAGTTTLSKSVCSLLEKKDYKTIWTKGPSDGPISHLIWTNDEISHKAKATLFLADRFDIEDRIIKPNLARGNNVICDRYIWSSVAYQSYFLDTDFLVSLNSHHIPVDVLVFVDTNLNIAKTRRKHRDVNDEIQKAKIKYEQNNIQAHVYNMYLYLLHLTAPHNYSVLPSYKVIAPKHVILVDGTKEISDLTETVVDKLVSTIL